MKLLTLKTMHGRKVHIAKHVPGIGFGSPCGLMAQRGDEVTPKPRLVTCKKCRGAVLA